MYSQIMKLKLKLYLKRWLKHHKKKQRRVANKGKETVPVEKVAMVAVEKVVKREEVCLQDGFFYIFVTDYDIIK